MPRSRNMGGCANCRRHHVKCDQRRPHCRMCTKYNRVCSGYTRTLIFPGDNTSESGRVRGQLFTEDELRETSQTVRECVLSETAAKHVRHLEDLNDIADAELKDDEQVTRGPFGAFRSALTAQPLHFEVVAEPDFDGELNFEDFALGFDADEIVQDEYLADPFNLSDTTPVMLRQLPSTSLICSPEATLLGTASLVPDYPLFQVDEILRPISEVLGAQDNVPQEAPFLLKSYHESVVSCMTPVQSAKSPWNILFFAHAKDTLATITLSHPPGYASMCGFHAILSISASCQRVSSPSQRWHQIASVHRLQGKKCLQLVWADAFARPKKVKYKAILIGLLSMIQASALAGLMEEAESYLLDTERFIRRCGLSKPTKSRRVRLLHHCYSFPRIFYESTFVLDIGLRQPFEDFGPAEDSGALTPEQDSPEFQLGGWAELYQDMMGVKSKESGENDLHLERPGLWAATLYPDIFGIPESFLVLLSQTIRLRNELTAAEDDLSPAKMSSKDLRSRSKSLENCILHWRDHTRSDKMSWDPRLGIETASADHRAVLRDMLEGLSEALCIYFYRRIHNFHPSLLQEKVRSVRDSLLRCDQSGDFLYRTAGFSWSAFIAACEATDSALQASFAMWFTARIQNIGWPCFATMLDVAKKTWARNVGAWQRVSWPEILREENIRIFYSC